MRKHTATELLNQGALAIVLPLVNTILSQSLFNSVIRDVLYDNLYLWIFVIGVGFRCRYPPIFELFFSRVKNKI